MIWRAWRDGKLEMDYVREIIEVMFLFAYWHIFIRSVFGEF